MNFFDIFIGLQGAIISSLILLPVLLLMLLISIKLFRQRRKKSYLTLSISLLLTLLDHLASIWLSSITITNVWIDRGITVVGECAFILLLLGFYQLYHLTSVKVQGLFYGLCLAAGGLSLLNSWFQMAYMAVIMLASLILLGSRVGNDHKFRWAIFTFLLTDGVKVWMEWKEQPEHWPLFAVKVLPVLSYSILFFILLERVIEVMQKSHLSSITDALTGIFNRRHFYENVQRAVNAGRPVTVIFSDIDNFKRLNDTRGHKAGDDVLKQVANILKEELDGIGMAGRYGGEELVGLVRNEAVDLKQLTERIRFRIEKETDPGVTASIGYSTREEGVSHEELIKQADQAMYQAKTTGKNKVVRYAK
ncbi:GGDEF domain-containing protein [Cohnella sp. AR92]|uniref:GGDEF domain-containing protein n=1 Tax=Cohnella sp. AR92 TaxID=648716 RepID=UPI0013151536|nr:GGDEF domain-containing protein [Cohnella sp. AR92]